MIRIKTAVIIILFLCSLSGNSQTGSTSGVSFKLSSQTFRPMDTFKVELGDLDNDGDIDAVFANMFDNKAKVFLNDGNGLFTDSGQDLASHMHDGELADLDNDGDLDLCLIRNNDSLPSKIYLNNGKGVFEDSGQDLNDVEKFGGYTDFLDFDNDNDLDVSLIYHQSDNKIFLNNGKAEFTETSITFPDESIWGDLDSDGDFDLFVRDRKKGYKAMLNNGNGVFTVFWTFADTTLENGQSLLLDIDNDNDLDVVSANGDFRRKSYATRIFLNNGRGKFTESKQKLLPVPNGRIGVGDLNNDGYPDVLLTGYNQPVYVFLNNGSGFFLNSVIELKPADIYSDCRIADLDGDGDKDVFASGIFGGTNKIWFNEKFKK